MNKQLSMTTAMAAALLALPGCSNEPEWNGDVTTDRDTAICVNKEGERVDDDQCARHSHAGGGYHGGGGSNAFLWYYLGRQSAVPYYGESIHDRRFAGRGSFQAQSGAVYHAAPAETRMSRSRAVSRGGLGSSSRRFGGVRS
jgi:hypothetical protein